MGFSVSGATAVILIGGLIAFSFAFSAVNNGYERVSEAQEDREDRQLMQANSDVGIANATYDSGTSTLTVNATNTGSSELVVGRVSLLVDGAYRSNVTTAIDGDATTDVFLPGEVLTMTVNQSVRPDRVKVITGTGVAAISTEVNASA
ncbi:flagellin [Salinarchaeum sp. Harcht-Bsk1]|uniref:flagellin n=1 Tax=Salinarchaeum sp. Harcht-Bsk1 TaxID=1333523 RepID=UPI000342343D|nr:flagellin [Salinarchaeum sp. Harcht-Bsk1]AGN02338.1 flagellin [Salinarchaeum sp. Harcht-Bsk1]